MPFGKGGGGGNEANAAAAAQAEIAGQLFRQTQGFRDVLFPSLLGFLTGAPPGTPVSAIPGGGVTSAGGGSPLLTGAARRLAPDAAATTGGEVPGGTIDIRQVLGITPAREALEAQFGNAREGLLNVGARGGQLVSELAGLERGRASAVGNLEFDARQRAFNQALSIATGSPALALSGLSGAGSTFANLEQARSTQDAAAKQGLGQAAATTALLAATK